MKNSESEIRRLKLEIDSDESWVHSYSELFMEGEQEVALPLFEAYKRIRANQTLLEKIEDISGINVEQIKVYKELLTFKEYKNLPGNEALKEVVDVLDASKIFPWDYDIELNAVEVELSLFDYLQKIDNLNKKLISLREYADTLISEVMQKNQIACESYATVLQDLTEIETEIRWCRAKYNLSINPEETINNRTNKFDLNAFKTI